MKFVTELLNSTAFGVTEVVKDRLYELRKLFRYDKPEYRRDVFTVSVDRDKMQFECECSKFEKDGILCCHILRLFTQFDIVKIPEEYILPRWTSEYREKELLKQRQESTIVKGTSSAENSMRYAMLLDTVNDVCVDISRDAHKSEIFIEEVFKLHKRLMSDEGTLSRNDGKTVSLRDPPVIKKGAAKLKNTTGNSEDNAQPQSAVPTGNSVSVWVNEDGSISKPEEENVKSKKRGKRKEQADGNKSGLKDPPVSCSKSVNKGSRLKPQSEKKSRKKKKNQTTTAD